MRIAGESRHVDALDADGVKVVARAAVPFEREPGESVAAVAPAETKPAEAKPAEAKPAAPATAGEAPAAPAAEVPAKVAAATPDAPETVAPKLEHGRNGQEGRLLTKDVR